MVTILSLFDATGNWSKPYIDAGYNVIRVDLSLGLDVMDVSENWLRQQGRIHGVLAAPPCTHFAASGARHWRAKDRDGRTAKALDLVLSTLIIIDWAQPSWWALENPVGRLNTLLPVLSKYGPTYFQPHHYGDPYTKKTGLWGVFNKNLPKNSVLPIRDTTQGSWVTALGGASDRTKHLRSQTPLGFAYAFFKANP